MWLLGLVVLMDSTDQSIVRGVVPQLKAGLHVGDLAVGLLMSAFVLVNGLVTLPSGYLADRWHRSRTIGTTVLGWSGISALTAAAPNFGVMLGIRGMLGFGAALTEPSAGSLMSDLYPYERRGRAFSIQQAMTFVGFALGVGAGGAVGTALGWRYAFLLVGGPGVLIGLACYRLREPRRGWSDRLHAGVAEDHDEPEPRTDLLAGGVRNFVREMVAGLRQDLRMIWSIPTMRYALVGVATLLFTLTAVSSWLPEFYERQLHLRNNAATTAFALLAVVGGVPGILCGGWVADHWAPRIRGGRVAVPAYCVLAGASLFTISYLWLPFAACYAVELVGLFVMALSVASIRATFSDAIPANLRGAGFGAFNLVAVIFGTAAAPFVVSLLSQMFGNDLRTAFLISTPPVLLGAWILLRAREHLEADAARIFAAVVAAAQAEQERQAALVVDLTDSKPAGGTGVPTGSGGRDPQDPGARRGGSAGARDGQGDAGPLDLVEVALDHDGDVRGDDQAEVRHL
jgi:MFS transporter, Spinster family, sphingosine-1-phosphate transporter